MIAKKEHGIGDPGEGYCDPQDNVRMADGGNGGAKGVDTSSKSEQLSGGGESCFQLASLSC